jgi:hypothetical protein
MKTMAIREGIQLAETEEEKRAVFRFRYEIYVEEMGRYRDVADHDNRLFSEPYDEYSRITYVGRGGKVVATARLTWGGLAPIPARMIEQYHLQPFLKELPPDAIAVGERGMIAPELRGSDLLLELLGTGLRFANSQRIQLTFGNCEPHLLTVYLDLGHRTYSRENWNSDSGYLIPLLLAAEDVEYLRKLDSPLLECVTDFGDDARVPGILKRFEAEGSAVTSRRFTAPRAYWGQVHEALSQAEAQRVSALDGLSEEEASRCLEKSNIIECDAGDRVLKKGGMARNLFVVLDGTLEVRDGERRVRELRPGDVFGEIAFLLKQPRSMDIYATADGVRVLSLSETLIRKMIENDPEVAARLLLNISKMLCLRVIQRD